MLNEQSLRQPRPNETSRSTRQTIHDIRNLFGVVASASHMLEDGPPLKRRAMLIGAIEDAATRGAQLTTDLLSHSSDQSGCVTIDLNEELRSLERLIRALVGNIRMQLCEHSLFVRLSRSGIDATLLELISNACAAFRVPGHVTVRTRQAGSCAWVIIADDAGGMSNDVLQSAMTDRNEGSASGNGLNRVRRFVGESHGRLHIRSHEGRGTVAVISFPLVLGLTTSRS
jgi:signal transduction histidine kinase